MTDRSPISRIAKWLDEAREADSRAIAEMLVAGTSGAMYPGGPDHELQDVDAGWLADQLDEMVDGVDDDNPDDEDHMAD